MNRQTGFTRVELLVVLSVVAVLVCLLIPTQRKPKTNSQQIKCSSNLRQIALAANFFAEDHGGCYPFGTTNSFAYQDTNSAWRHFMTMSNELGLCSILVCPVDPKRNRNAAVNFGDYKTGNLSSLEHMQNAAVSYFVALRPRRAQGTPGQTIMFGDRNVFIPGKRVEGAQLKVTPGDRLLWNARLHTNVGNVVHMDCSVSSHTDKEPPTATQPVELLLPLTP